MNEVEPEDGGVEEEQIAGDVEVIHEKLPLTDTEKIDLGEQIARKELKLAELEVEKSEIASTYNDAIKDVKKDIREASAILDKGFTVEEHKTFMEVDLEDRKKRWRDTATGLVVRERPLEAGDQGTISF